MDFRKYADPHNPAIDRYRTLLNVAAGIANVPPCALAAIVEIESNGRNELQEGVPAGDPNCGVGLCQITYGVNWSDLTNPSYRGFALLSENNNLTVASRYFLRPAIDAAIALREIPAHATWMQSVNGQLLFWAFSIYNIGAQFITECVDRHRDPDEYTTDQYGTRALTVYLRNVARSQASAA